MTKDNMRVRQWHAPYPPKEIARENILWSAMDELSYVIFSPPRDVGSRVTFFLFSLFCWNNGLRACSFLRSRWIQQLDPIYPACNKLGSRSQSLSQKCISKERLSRCYFCLFSSANPSALWGENRWPSFECWRRPQTRMWGRKRGQRSILGLRFCQWMSIKKVF